MSEPRPPAPSLARRLGPYLLLAVLALLFFGKVLLHPGEVLYSDRSDLLEETLPAKRFLVRSWHETGELPLWCPYAYAGLPFLHDVKVGMFYPPHWPLLLLPETALGAALTWLVVLHVVVAGWGAFAYARFRGLGVAGALVAAIGYMFAGKWMLHLLAAGHYFMAPVAWLPLVLLGLEAAVARRSLAWATFAGAVFGVLVLGCHPQITFYSGVFVGLWTLGPALESAGFLGGTGPRSRRRTVTALARWLGYGAWCVAVGAGLAAVELLPALEATREATRGGGVGAASAGALDVVVSLFGPSLGGQFWERRAAIGALWLATAAMAPVLRQGRTRFEAAVLVLLVVFALGGAALVQSLPGFGLFQLYTRMLIPGSFALALLAGTAVDALTVPVPPLPRLRARWVFLGFAGVAALLAGWAALLVPWWPPAVAWWALLLAGVPLLAVLIDTTLTPARAAAWGAVLLAELWVSAWPLLELRPVEEIYRPSEAVSYLAEHATRERVMDRGLDALPKGVTAPGFPDEPAVTPLTPGLAVVERIEPLRGYNSLDVQRYKDYLQMTAGHDDPVRPREGALGFPIMGYFPVKNKPMLDLLGVRYLLQPEAAPLDPGDWKPVLTDEAPEAYQVIVGGRRVLPPFRLYENPAAFPRAFVVGQARPLPDRKNVLRAMSETDFRRVVLLEGHPGGAVGEAGEFHPADVTDYQPNRVAVRADGPGFLVLADIAFPGWGATIDGQPTRLYRADYLFRGIELPAGRHEVVFRFEPASYERGRVVSLVAVGLLILASGAASARRVFTGR
ncbi:MAG TPA: hypothetical protein VFW33_17405 [Gemmataceae bacterium]|nr:hypothetical protein [Gemmataceae bacterium]